MTERALSDAFEGIEFTRGVAARMRDGASLASDVYRPKGDGPWPVLLMRTAYGRDIASGPVYAPPVWFARRGFIVAVQDVRGRGDSEGSYYPFRHEREDGYDSVQWAAGLPCSNGCVGMYGFSYQGAVQLFAALDRPPALRALAPHMTAFDMYSGWFYRNGLLEMWTLSWANQMLREDARRTGAASCRSLDESWLDAARLSHALPLRTLAPLTNEDLPAYAADWLRQSSYGAFWEPWNLLLRVKEIGYPMFHLSGWYDIFLRGSLAGFSAMARERNDQFLLASPWAHMPWASQILGVDLGPQAEPKVDDLLVRWFRHWLQPDSQKGPSPLQGCRYFSVGENAWRSSPTWPPEQAREIVLHLASQGRANSRFGDGLLSEEPREGNEDVLNYDPETPVKAPGGSDGTMGSFGPHDLAPLQQENSILVYTSEHLKHPLRIAGEPRCVIHIQATSPTVDLVARLSRVSDDGRAVLLCLGAAQVAAPKPTRVEFTLDPVAASWGAQERIRLDLACSAFPLFPRNSGTDAHALDVASPSEFRRAVVLVFHDPSRQSTVRLPVAEGD